MANIREQNIIKNPLYLGHTIMCRKGIVFKVGVYKNVPEADQIRVENTHEPLVSQEIFDGANAKVLSRRRDTTDNFVSPLFGACEVRLLRQGVGLAVLGEGQAPYLYLHHLRP